MNIYINIDGKYYTANVAITSSDIYIENPSSLMTLSLVEGQVYSRVEMLEAGRLYNLANP